MENLKKVMRSLGRFSEPDLDLLISHLKTLSVPKNSFLLSQSQICKSIYFVDLGSFRQYLMNEKGEEITKNLYVENDWILDFKSFTAQCPSTSQIQASEDSEVFELSVFDLHKLMKVSDTFFQVARIFQYSLEPHTETISKPSPKERYVNLLKTKPQLVQRFPLKYIASYLDITPETLSRVRRSIS